MFKSKSLDIFKEISEKKILTEIRVANKLAFSFGGIPERSKGADCKSVA